MNNTCKNSLKENIKASVLLWLDALFPTILTMLIFLPSLEHPFLNWDDPVIVENNIFIRHLNSVSFSWIFTTLFMGVYTPLTWLSYTLDYRLGGLNPWIYHLSNVIIHGINTLLVYLLSIKFLNIALNSKEQNNAKLNIGMKTSAAFITALIFGVHPLHVEPVAWITDRMDLLCCLFYLASLFFYLDYAQKVKNRKRMYIVSLAFFILSLMSKAMAVSFPLILIVLDIWPLKRFNADRPKIVYEKIPFIIPAVLLGIQTIIARLQIGALASWDIIPFTYRVMNAFHSLMFYLVKMVVPVDLCALYPIRLKQTFSIEYVASAFGVILITLICYLNLKKRPFLAIAWLFYAVTLFPTLGIVHVGSQSAADRYSYLPSLAPFLIIGTYLAHLFSSRRRIFILIIAITTLLGLGTTKQLHTWSNSISLWENVLKTQPKNSATAFSGMGEAYKDVGRFDEALMMYETALKMDPQAAYLSNGKGKILYEMGKTEAAIQAFKAAITNSVIGDEQNGWAHCHLDIIYTKMGLKDQALIERKAAFASSPNDAWQHYDLANIYEKNEMPEQAIRHIQEATRQYPWYAEAYDRLGLLYKSSGNADEAVKSFEKAVSIEPQNALYRHHLLLARKNGSTN